MEPNLDYNVLMKFGDLNVGDNVEFMGEATDNTGRGVPAGTKGSVSNIKGPDEVYVKPSGENVSVKVKMNQIRKVSSIIGTVEVSGKDLLL